MQKIILLKSLIGISAVAAVFGAFAVQAQAAGQALGALGPTAAGAGAITAGPLNPADQKMVTSMAQANLAEIEMARMAQGKSQNEQVRNFAQQMIDDHTKAYNDVRQLAQAKGMTAPTAPHSDDRAMADRLAAMSGESFDRAYMAQAGVTAHRKTHNMLGQVQDRAADPDVKALAGRTLPIVDQHLNSAEKLQEQVAQGAAR